MPPSEVPYIRAEIRGGCGERGGRGGREARQRQGCTAVSGSVGGGGERTHRHGRSKWARRRARETVILKFTRGGD